MSNLDPLKAAIYEVGLLFAKSSHPTEAQINAYARALQRYTPEQITYAFNQIILKGSAFFPSLAEVLTFLRPQQVSNEDAGNLIADEIVNAALSFGFYRTMEAYNSLSEEAKIVLGASTRLLKEICESEREELSIIKSQIRKLAVARVANNKAQIHNEKLQAISGNTAPQLRDLSGLQLIIGEKTSEG